MLKTVLATLALGAAMASAPATAQGQGGGFAQRDQTRAEAQQRADMMFQMLDGNHDGTLTKTEADAALAQFQAMRGDDDNGGRRVERVQRMLAQAFGAAQSLTKAQFEAQALARFDAADLNHDGTVTAAEREQLRAARQGQAAPATPAAPANPAAPVAPPKR